MAGSTNFYSAKNHTINYYRNLSDIGRGNPLHGVGSIIDSYNETNKSVLLEPMPNIENLRLTLVNLSSVIGPVYSEIGFSIAERRTNSISNDRVSNTYKYREYLILQRTSFSVQSGYAIYPLDRLSIIGGSKFELGRYKYLIKTFAASTYANYSNNEYSLQPMIKSRYGGVFTKVVFVNGKNFPILLFGEAYYLALLNKPNLATLNESINPTTFQNDDNTNLNLSGGALGFRIGVFKGIDFDR